METDIPMNTDINPFRFYLRSEEKKDLSISTPRSFLDEVLASVEREEAKDTWVRSKESIKDFVENFVPRDFFDLNKANPQQVKVLVDLEKGTRNFIIRAPRKGGKTILVAIICVWLCLRFERFRVFVLAGSLEQARWLYRYCRDIVTKNPMIRNRLLQEPTQTLTEFRNGSWIVCSPASDKQIHAPTADCLVMDEYVLIDPEIVVGAWPMIRASTKPMRFILSTAREKVGLDSFLDIFDRADELGFSAYWWSDAQCPWLSKEDSVLAKQILSEDSFRIQYQGGIPQKRGAIFSRVSVDNAFLKPKKLLDLFPYFDSQVKGTLKGGVDWGFTHETAFTVGWMGLDFRLHVLRQEAFTETDDEELANVALDWDQDFFGRFRVRIEEWNCDAAGAFQNAMMRKKGLWVVPRVFQHRTKGKEWMISILNWYLDHGKIVISDIPEFQELKRQMKAYRRDQAGNPVKGFDHRIDSLLCLASGWDPLETIEAPKERRSHLEEIEVRSNLQDYDLEDIKPRDEEWRPAHWRQVRWPWENE